MEPPKRSWTNNEAMLVLFEVFQTIESESIARTPLDISVKASIDASLKRIDPYSEYLSPEHYQRFRESQQSNYAGIGAELQTSPEGRVLLRPYRESPAARAGIETGDELIAIGQESVTGQSLTEITQKVRGKAGTPVRLFIRKPDGSVKSPVLLRAPTRAESVEASTWMGFEIIHIYQFTPTTQEELRRCMDILPPEQPILLDLRENTGGDLLRAIDCAALFLPEHAFVVRIAKPESVEDHRAASPGIYHGRSVFLLQNEQTASAAEVFIAALLPEPTISNWGQRSFGKGVTQQIYPMSNGGALILTNATLQREDGSSWNGLGIEPAGDLDALRSQLPDIPQPRLNP